MAAAGNRAAALAPRVQRPAASRLSRERVRSAWLFLTPMIVVLALVAGWPLVRTIWFSLTDANLADLSTAQFVGLTNFVYLLSDPEWWHAVRNTLVFTAITITLETILGMAVALALHAHFAGRGLLRAAVLIPWAIPTVVSAQMWAWMFNDVFGVINHIGMGLGLLAKPVAWTASPDTAMAAVVIVDVWKTTPFMALLILAGLQMIPEEIYEATRIDGVHPVRVFFKVTLPLLKPVIVIQALFQLIDNVYSYNIVSMMFGQGAGHPGEWADLLMPLLTRQSFSYWLFGQGAAVSFVLMALMLAAVALWLRAFRGSLVGEHV